MQLLKLALISIVAFFLLLSSFTLFIPSKVRISRAIDIRANKKQVLPYLQHQDNWKLWNLYAQDSIIKRSITISSVTDSLVKSHWESGGKKFNSGLAIYEMRQGTTTLQWYFDFSLSWYPWEKIGSIAYDQQMGPFMQESLAKLKEIIESNP